MPDRAVVDPRGSPGRRGADLLMARPGLGGWSSAATGPALLAIAMSLAASLAILLAVPRPIRRTRPAAPFRPPWPRATSGCAIGALDVRIDLQADAIERDHADDGDARQPAGGGLLGRLHARRPGYARFFAEFALFVFSMCMLVLAGSFLVLFVFWEGVGLCSYLLIGFWYRRPSAAAAARKAFLVNRIGDFGFLLGVLLIWDTFGTLNYDRRPRRLRRGCSNWRLQQPGVLVGICLLLFLGAVGKSAQFPLHVWLPDAMEGPSPVSALIHAATMVTAGVYLVARCTPLFELAPAAQLVVAGIGGFTALLAALTALTQNDLKRVLAYSTVSQLGYMFLALGCGIGGGPLLTLAVTAAMFHLFTHAFFKALLFLSAGSVMHAMGDVIDMRQFGGLRRVLPLTHWTFLCGAAALAGVPLLSGFWSKDEILLAVAAAADHAALRGVLPGAADAPRWPRPC